MSEVQQFQFNSTAKKKVFTALGIGIVLTIIGILGLQLEWWGARDTSHGHAEHKTEETAKPSKEGHGDSHGKEAKEAKHGHEKAAHGHEAKASEHKHASSADKSHDTHKAHDGEHAHHKITTKENYKSKRIKADLWHNIILFTGIAVIGIFFYAIQYLGWAGWSTLLNRVFLSFGYGLIPMGALLVIGFWVIGGDIFIWTDDTVMNSSKHLLAKKPFLTSGFFTTASVIFLAVWGIIWFFMTKQADKEDVEGGNKPYTKTMGLSAVFIVFFAFTSSVAAWMWVMSIEPFWFSTMFGWYMFASWFVTGLSAMTLVILLLKQKGYLPKVNANHIHNMGLFMFAFSIFWSYVWFSQFLLIWYANIPEEGVYYIERMFNNEGVYIAPFIINLVINFLFPFFFMMTRASKRSATLLKVAAVGLIIGHWIDFYVMIMPNILQEYGGFDLGTIFLELGMTLVFGSLFSYIVMFGLSKRALVAEKHPMIDESVHHHY